MLESLVGVAVEILGNGVLAGGIPGALKYAIVHDGLALFRIQSSMVGVHSEGIMPAVLRVLPMVLTPLAMELLTFCFQKVELICIWHAWVCDCVSHLCN